MSIVEASNNHRSRTGKSAEQSSGKAAAGQEPGGRKYLWGRPFFAARAIPSARVAERLWYAADVGNSVRQTTSESIRIGIVLRMSFAGTSLACAMFVVSALA